MHFLLNIVAVVQESPMNDDLDQCKIDKDLYFRKHENVGVLVVGGDFLFVFGFGLFLFYIYIHTHIFNYLTNSSIKSLKYSRIQLLSQECAFTCRTQALI